MSGVPQHRRMEEGIHANHQPTNPVEFKPDTVILDVNGTLQEIANDYVWIFAPVARLPMTSSKRSASSLECAI